MPGVTENMAVKMWWGKRDFFEAEKKTQTPSHHIVLWSKKSLVLKRHRTIREAEGEKSLNKRDFCDEILLAKENGSEKVS